MAPNNKKKIEVDEEALIKMQEQMAELERRVAEGDARVAGINEVLSDKASTNDTLKEKKSFEPKFRTVRIRKYPMAGDYNNQGYVIGWTSRGAYQEVDRSGISPSIVDMIDVFFLGHDRTEDGKLKAEKIRLLDLMNNGVQVHCKVIKETSIPRKEPTGEEIAVQSFDEKHGLQSTGELIDGYVAYSDVKLTIQIPGVSEEVEIDSKFVNF